MTDRIEKKELDKSIIALSQWPFFTANSAVEYWIDAWQRSDPPYVLFCMSLVGSRGDIVDYRSRD